VPDLHRDGVGLHYEVFGDAAATPLLLLEGMGGEIAGWRRNIPTLAGSFRVVALDARGNGRSDKPDRPAAMADHAADALAVLDELGIARAHVFGQSFGGMVAQLLALDHADRVLGLVLACTSAGPRLVVRGPARAPKGRPYRALYAPEFPDANPEHVAEDLLAGAPTRQPLHARRRQREAMAGFDAWHRLGEIRAPTLVMHGTRDQLLDPENARRLAAAIPGARLHLLEGAGHMFHSERAEETNRAVVAFLSRAAQ
jgi:3-oxoadipate enol-lactonase